MSFDKTFLPGEVLTAANVNEHLLNGGYQYRQTLYFFSSGAFVKQSFPWLRAICVKVVGGGGGGGGAAETTNVSSAAGAGGQGGSYAESFITDIAALNASVTVTRGGGGAGGAAGNNSGALGCDSSFGSLVVAGGGGEGGGSVATTASRMTFRGSSSNNPSVGDFVVDGTGSAGLAIRGGDGILAKPGEGGASFLSSARSGSPDTPSDDGLPGNLFGGGGSGAFSRTSSPAQAGGAGANGIVIVELYG